MNRWKIVNLVFKLVCVLLLIFLCFILWKTYEQSKVIYEQSKVIKRQNDGLWRQGRQTQMKLSMKGSIFRNEDVKFYVPNYPMDGIQRNIVDKQNFYELELLKQLDALLPNNPVILDIGANVGNHTLYWLLKSPKKAKHIYSFEVIDETYDILKKNVEINNLKDKVTLYNFGLSNVNSNAKILGESNSLMSCCAVMEQGEGGFQFKRLDDVGIQEKVDFVKIDVEGQEIPVIEGAKKLLNKYKPMMWVEVWTDESYKKHKHMEKSDYKHNETFNKLMDSMGYVMIKKMTHRDYIYIHKSKIKKDQAIN